MSRRQKRRRADEIAKLLERAKGYRLLHQQAAAVLESAIALGEALADKADWGELETLCFDQFKASVRDADWRQR